MPAAWMLAVALAAGASGAHAERADRSKPLNFTADALRYDDVRQVNVLTGNVEITKGTMIVRAARVEVSQVGDGQQSAVATSSGRRAYFRQKRDDVDEYLEGEAERIEYNGQANTLRLVGRAEIRRLRGTAVADEVSGHVITYDNVAEVFTVQGGSAANGGDGRVRGVLTPRGAEPADAPGATN